MEGYLMKKWTRVVMPRRINQKDHIVNHSGLEPRKSHWNLFYG